MLKTYKAHVEDDGRTMRLAEPGTLPRNVEVYVSIVESGNDEEFVGGYPVTMLLSASSLARDWDTAEEDEAWKDFQRRTNHADD